ncbi:glycosyltransferase [Salinispora cortesiana]|uniref:glycosyltransferase n=1 Tax=Salinispora cortesiana TaxID=1305843 RepID=UPI00046F8BED|nr:glycosyltransferase [Salinispora cortesiana]
MTGDLTSSVIIPTYNRRRLLSYTLDSLVGQSLPAEWFEVVVVDDGSDDGTGELVGRYHDRLNLRYFRRENEGWRVAAARNVGIAAARGEVTVLLDSGVLLHSGGLAAHVARHRRDDAPVAAIGYVYGFNTDNQDAEEMSAAIRVGDVDGTIAQFAAAGRWLDVREEFYARHDDEFHDLPAPWVVFWTCNVSARTAQLRAAGGFDEEFRSWGGEDLDLAYRLCREGVRIVLERRASSIHYPHHKNHAEHDDIAEPNHHYFAAKYGTPIAKLLPSLRDITPLRFNDVIRERGLPRCADFVAEQTGAGGVR